MSCSLFGSSCHPSFCLVSTMFDGRKNFWTQRLDHSRQRRRWKTQQLEKAIYKSFSWGGRGRGGGSVTSR